MPVDGPDALSPVRSLRAEPSLRPESRRTGRFRGRTTSAGTGPDHLPGSTRAQSPGSRRVSYGKALLARAVARLRRAVGWASQSNAGEAQPQISWPVGRPPSGRSASSAQRLDARLSRSGPVDEPAENLLDAYANVGQLAQARAEAEQAYEQVGDGPIYEELRPAGADEPVYAEVGGAGPGAGALPDLLDAVARLTGPNRPADVNAALQPLYEEMRGCADAIAAGESDYEDMSPIYQNLLATVDHLVECGQLDGSAYVEMRSYENLLDAYANVGQLAQARAEAEQAYEQVGDGPIYEELRPAGADEPVYAEVEGAGPGAGALPDLLDAVARLTGPNRPADVNAALQPLYEEMRGCADAIAAGESDYEDMSPIYQNLLATVDHLVECGQLDGSAYVEMRSYENLLDAYANVGQLAQARAEAEQAYEQVGDGPIYEELRPAGADEPVYAEVEGAGPGAEALPDLLDAVARLTGPNRPADVNAALQPLYEEMRGCADAIAAGESDYEDMSPIYQNLLTAVERLVEDGVLDDATYVDMSTYRNDLETAAVIARGGRTEPLR